MDLMLQAGLFFLAVHSVAGSHQPVKVGPGQDAILPCHLEPPFHVTTQMVEWKRYGQQVHLYRSKADSLDDQDENFRNRTSLFHDEMDNGNISLKLTNVTEVDAGNYTCHVRFKNEYGLFEVRIYNVTLIVDGGTRTDPTNTLSGGDVTGRDTATAVIVVIIIIIIVIAASFTYLLKFTF